MRDPQLSHCDVVDQEWQVDRCGDCDAPGDLLPVRADAPTRERSFHDQSTTLKGGKLQVEIRQRAGSSRSIRIPRQCLP